MLAQSTFCFEEKGRTLFVQHCLSCHSTNGLASNFNFTDLKRTLVVKNQLIEKLKNYEMPPGQYSEKDKHLVFESNTVSRQLHDDERAELIRWLNFDFTQSTLNFKSNYHTSEVSNISTKYDSTLTLSLNNIFPLIYFRNYNNEMLIYKIPSGSFSEKVKQSSLVGLEVKHPSFLHHFELSSSAVPIKNPLAFWGIGVKNKIFYYKPRKLFENNNSDLFAIIHSDYKENISILPDKAEITLFLSNQKPVTELSTLFASSRFLFNTQIMQNFKVSKTTNLKNFSIHTHKNGNSFEFLIYKPLLKEPLFIGKFFGVGSLEQSNFGLKKYLLLNRGDTVSVKCNYKNAPISIGPSAENEMCLLIMAGENSN